MDVFQLTFTKEGEIKNFSSFPEKLTVSSGNNINDFLSQFDIDNKDLKLGIEFNIPLNNSIFSCVLLKSDHNFQILGRNTSETTRLKEEIVSLNKISDLNMVRLLKTLDELKEAKKSVEKTNKFREEFISNISHEMRTPLTAVMGFSEILLSSDIKEEDLEYINLIKKSSDDLLVIINDLLDISSINAGKIEISESVFDLQVLSERVSNNILQIIKNKSLNFTFNNNVKDNIYLIGDKVRLIQVLFNLLSNSVKYTKKGEITFKVDISEQSILETVVVFTVKDTGVGIAKEKIDNIFNEFYQIKQDGFYNPVVGGVGLGLSIVKRLVSLMKGELTVKSELNKGSEFTVIIPFKNSNTPPKSLQFNIKTKTNSTKKSALIVEDIKTNQMILSKILQNENIDVTIVNNGKEAIDLLTTDQFDIIFMDIQMPILNGEEATKIIRNELDNDTPIIAITAHAFDGVEEKCIQAGMNGFITKPFDQNKIITELKKLNEDG